MLNLRTLFGIRILADVIKAKVKMRSCRITVGPKSNGSVLLRDREGHRDTQGEGHRRTQRHTGRGPQKTGKRSDAATAKEFLGHQKLGKGRKEPLLEVLEEAWPS